MADYDYWTLWNDLNNVNDKHSGEAFQWEYCGQMDPMLFDLNANVTQVNSVASEIREVSPVSVAWFPMDQTVQARPVADSKVQVQQNPIRVQVISEPEVTGQSFNFQIVIERGKGTKGAPFMFSSDLNKLFANQGTKCPVQLNTTIPAQFQGQFYIRVHMLYSEDDDLLDPVRRCPEHAKGNPQQPVMKCNHSDAKYEQLGIHDTIVLPLDFCSKDGFLYTVPSFEFICRSTCPSIRRRPLKLVFALERWDGSVVYSLVEKSILLKISIRPGRDIIDEEEKKKNGKNTEKKKIRPVNKKKIRPT
jgi:P53 DNA-binding domain